MNAGLLGHAEVPFPIRPTSAIIGVVGSKGIRPRKRRWRLPPPDVKGDVEWPGWDTPGSQFTFEGYLRSLRRFVLGRGQAEGWQRHLATGLIWLILGPLLVGVIIGIATVLWRLIGS
ncbi:MAG TPA: hypothetical protein VJ010_00875 [Actinomycetota bacterium]|nr:hypothetical protein [Actinomycetota bacterium]